MLRQNLLFAIMVMAGLLLATACSNNDSDAPSTDSNQTATTEASTPAEDTLAGDASRDQFIVSFPPERAETLMLLRQEIFDWIPSMVDRLSYALEDVTKIVMLSDLGLGDQIDVTLPRISEGWPVGQSVRLKLDANRTALALRFVIDTLPGPRTRGEGVLGIFAVHTGDSLGRDIDIARTQSGTGRLDMLFSYERVVAQLNCCDLPPTLILNGFGDLGDTLCVIVTFDRTNGQYLTTFVGPRHGRSYAGRSYVKFRTERGEFHKDVDEYPYMYETTDPGWVNLFIGSRWRGKKTCTEPILTARIF